MTGEQREDKVRVLFERYAGELFRFVQSMAPGDIDAKDVVQETFIRAFQSLDQLRNEEMARAWLYKIARNILYDLIRKRGVELRSLGLQPRESSGDGVGSSIEVLDAMKSLPIPYQQVLYLRAVKDFTISEIATILAKTQASVRVTLHRAKKALAAQLEFDDAGHPLTEPSLKGGAAEYERR